MVSISRYAGIDICLNHCPYEECISTENNACPAIIEHIMKVKREEKQLKEDKINKIIQEIDDEIVNNGPLLTTDIMSKWGLDHNKVSTLMRQGRLVYRKNKSGRYSRMIIGTAEKDLSLEIKKKESRAKDRELKIKEINKTIKSIEKAIIKDGPILTMDIKKKWDISYNTIGLWINQGRLICKQSDDSEWLRIIIGTKITW